MLSGRWNVSLCAAEQRLNTGGITRRQSMKGKAPFPRDCLISAYSHLLAKHSTARWRPRCTSTLCVLSFIFFFCLLCLFYTFKVYSEFIVFYADFLEQQVSMETGLVRTLPLPAAFSEALDAASPDWVVVLEGCGLLLFSVFSSFCCNSLVFLYPALELIMWYTKIQMFTTLPCLVLWSRRLKLALSQPVDPNPGRWPLTLQHRQKAVALIGSRWELFSSCRSCDVISRCAGVIACFTPTLTFLF